MGNHKQDTFTCACMCACIYIYVTMIMYAFFEVAKKHERHRGRCPLKSELKLLENVDKVAWFSWHVLLRVRRREFKTVIYWLLTVELLGAIGGSMSAA